MEQDLSLSRSFGGLRIANPDDQSSNSLGDDSMRLTTSGSKSSNADKTPSYQIPSPSPTDLSVRSSHLDFDPSSFSLDALSTNQGQASEKPLLYHTRSFIQRQPNRQSIPLTYQDQQQAQFPQYPTMVPLSQRHPSSASRPVSTIYPHVVNINGDEKSREGPQYPGNDATRTSIPGTTRKNSSRGAGTQAGVPIRDESYTDRSYRNSQQIHNVNSQSSPRRSSRGMGGGQVNGPSAFMSLSSGSPYALEGGPMVSSEEWQEKGAAMGIRAEIDPNGKPVLKQVKKGVKDFHFGRTLGEGSYSTVMAATDRQTHQQYAIKVLDKKHIIKEKKVKYVNIEKDTLNKLTNHPGVVRLYYTFQDMQSLYFVLDLASGGELLGVLKRMKTFDEDCTRFYGAQILDTVEYMHSQGVIHRDLKPENVLLDDKMHVKVTDFGTAKILDSERAAGETNHTSVLGSADNTRASSFVGTAEYVSPELLTDKNACKASDLWAFGCIIYQLLAGRPPFKAANEFLTFRKITNLEYEFPDGFPEVARDLVERLLVLDPSRRLTVEHAKNHEFFDGVVWGRGLWKQKAPKLKSFIPPVQDPIKFSNHTTENGNPNNFPPSIAPSHSTAPTRFDGVISSGPPKSSPRIVTELPPPSQLDIEWSPVLTNNNERILKLGNLSVLSSPAPPSPNSRNGLSSSDADTPKKFSRFFGSSAPKKRQRLVMVTSSARIVIVAAGGDEKKAKVELSLLGDGCTWKAVKDSKGLTYWSIETVNFSGLGIRAVRTNLWIA